MNTFSPERMQQTSISGVPSPATAAPGRVALGALAAGVLIAISIPLAAPGVELIPGAGTGPGGAPGPRWVLGAFGDGFEIGPGLYLGLLYAATAAWALLLRFARELGLRAVAAVAGLLIAIFTLAGPLLSLDVFSYIAYARLGAEHGLDPYEFAPAAIPLDEAASRVDDYRDAVSVYGPLFTLGSYPLGALGVPAALWSLKAIAGLAIAAIAALVARLARLRGVDPATAVALVALNPLVLVHLVGGAHNDGLMVAVAIAAIAAALTGRPALAGAGFVAAAAIKVSAVIYAPFALVGSRDRGRLVAGALAALALLAAVSLLAFGPHVSEAFSVAGGNQDRISRWSVPATLARISGADVDLLRVIAAAAYAVAVAGLLVAVSRGLDWVRAAGWASFGLLIASAYMVPWYLIWLLPAAAISRDRILIGATILLTLFQVINGVPV
jgi:hypothetical protein